MKAAFLLFLATALCSCSIKESIITPPVQEAPAPLVLKMNTAAPTKALIKDSRLPDPSIVGITVRDSYGAYTGEGYTNVKYTSRDDNGAQVWESDSPVMLSTQSGTVYSYYPYADGIKDITSIPVRANSTVQTDFLWGTPVSASRDNRPASIILNHALASIIIPSGVTYVGNYCFSDCSNLRHIVSWPVITPNLGGNYRYNFLGVATGGVLAVPAAAKTGSNYSYWVASNINLGSYGWTLVYMEE